MFHSSSSRVITNNLKEARHVLFPPPFFFRNHSSLLLPLLLFFLLSFPASFFPFFLPSPLPFFFPSSLLSFITSFLPAFTISFWISLRSIVGGWQGMSCLGIYYWWRHWVTVCAESIWMVLSDDKARIPDLVYIQPQLCHSLPLHWAPLQYLGLMCLPPFTSFLINFALSFLLRLCTAISYLL